MLNNVKIHKNFVLNNINYPVKEIFCFNERKQQITFKSFAEKFGEVVVKYSLKKTRTISNEIDFYVENHMKHYIPVLNDYGDNYFILKYYKSITLLNYLEKTVDKNEIKFILEKINEFIEDFYTVKPYHLNADVKKYLLGCFTKLLTSGQYGRTRYQLSQHIAGIVNKIARKLLMLSIKEKHGNIQTIHGDLHLNNILVTNNNEILIIDWECTRRDSPLIDLMYLSAMINKKIRKCTDTYIPSSLACGPVLLRYSMNLAVLSNSKF